MPLFCGPAQPRRDHQIQNGQSETVFEYTILQMQHYPLEMIFFSVNYIHSDEEEDTYTEYEQKFNALNQPIYRALWRKHVDQ